MGFYRGAVLLLAVAVVSLVSSFQPPVHVVLRVAHGSRRRVPTRAIRTWVVPASKDDGVIDVTPVPSSGTSSEAEAAPRTPEQEEIARIVREEMAALVLLSAEEQETEMPSLLARIEERYHAEADDTDV